MDTDIEYQNGLKLELTKLRHNLHFNLKPFIQQYPRMTTGTFYRQCACTHAELYEIPKGFPVALKVADSAQVAHFYSNLCRTCLLLHEGYNNTLFLSTNRPTNFFSSFKIDTITLMEQRLELLKYLVQITSKKERRVPAVKHPRIQKSPPVDNLEYRLEQLELKVAELEEKINAKNSRKKTAL
jgi:hypothetical protein